MNKSEAYDFSRWVYREDCTAHIAYRDRGVDGKEETICGKLYWVSFLQAEKFMSLICQDCTNLVILEELGE